MIQSYDVLWYNKQRGKKAGVAGGTAVQKNELVVEQQEREQQSPRRFVLQVFENI
jgi:hypothetical protein